MNVGKHRICVERTSQGARCAVCRVALRKDGTGYYHLPGRRYAATEPVKP